MKGIFILNYKQLDDPPNYLLANIIAINQDAFTNPHLFIYFILLIILLVLAAIISAAEVAFFSLEPSHIDVIKKTKTKTDDKVLELLNSPKKLIATFLISINFVNIGIVVLSSVLIENEEIILFSSDTVRFLFQVVVVTFLILIIGEVIPKIYASRNPLALASAMALPVSVVQRFFSPLSSLMIFSTAFIEKRMKKIDHKVSVDDLSHALDLTSNEIATNHEKTILKGIVKFGNTDAKQIMTPRMDVIAFDKDTEFPELIKLVVDAGFSRIPVYQESADNIIGILHTKDLLKHLSEPANFDWKTLLRPAYFIPENKKIDDLLKEFQSKKTHIAVVVDEYGGTSGIITFEDIIEEIVGDISDEFDVEEHIYSKLDNNTYIFEAKIPLTDLYKIIDIDGKQFESAKGESDTLGGFILELMGKIPAKNEKINFEDYLFTIESADRRKVKRVKLQLVQSEKNA